MELLKNYWFWSAFSAWVLSQLIKIITGFFQKKRRSLATILFGTGGMPIAHTAAIVSLTTSLIVTEGGGSPLTKKKTTGCAV